MRPVTPAHQGVRESPVVAELGELRQQVETGGPGFLPMR